MGIFDRKNKNKETEDVKPVETMVEEVKPAPLSAEEIENIGQEVINAILLHDECSDIEDCMRRGYNWYPAIKIIKATPEAVMATKKVQMAIKVSSVYGSTEDKVVRERLGRLFGKDTIHEDYDMVTDLILRARCLRIEKIIAGDSFIGTKIDKSKLVNERANRLVDNTIQVYDDMLMLDVVEEDFLKSQETEGELLQKKIAAVRTQGDE